MAEAPDDDVARLVLADHLTELGDAQGEFISIQLSAADGRTRGLARIRERELLALHREAWLPRGVVARTAFFRRGLLHRCVWRESTDPLHRSWLSVEQLNGRWAEDASPFQVGRRPALRRLTGVKPVVWQALSSCAVPRLTHVDLELDAREFIEQLEPLRALSALEVLHFSAPLAGIHPPQELEALERLCRALSTKVPLVQLRVRRALFEAVQRASWRIALKLRVELIDVLEPTHRLAL